MPFNADSANNPFTEAGIHLFAVERSGVYGIYNNNHWIYIGETNNIQRRLLEHVRETGTCIKKSAPTLFCYELVGASQRVARQNQLILELNPACNQILG